MAINAFPAASAGKSLYVQTFNSSGTFTLPAGYDSNNPLLATVLIVGAGGGGGSGCHNQTSGVWKRGGSGGGSGIAIYLENISLTSNQSITIGSGGNGGTAPSNNNTGNAGTNGGSTVFGDWTAQGGRGGNGGGNINTGNYVLASSPDINNTIYGTIARGGSGTASSNNTYYGTAPGGAGGSAGGDSDRNGGSFGGASNRTNPTINNTYNSYRNVSDYVITPSQGFPFGYQGNAIIEQVVTDMPVNTAANMWFCPGGGGGGGGGYNTRGCGGTAGTLFGGGNAGAGQSTATQVDGFAAAANTGAGGGGGGASGNSVASGAGGAGGSGFVRVWYWA